MEPPLAAHLRTGRQGEEIALCFLSRLGWNILGRNVRIGKKDEIDLIAFDPMDRVIVFIEVKARKTMSASFRPEMNMTYRKKCCLFRAARHWVMMHDYEGGWRVDVLCVAEGIVTDHLREIRSV